MECERHEDKGWGVRCEDKGWGVRGVECEV